MDAKWVSGNRARRSMCALAMLWAAACGRTVEDAAPLEGGAGDAPSMPPPEASSDGDGQLDANGVPPTDGNLERWDDDGAAPSDFPLHPDLAVWLQPGMGATGGDASVHWVDRSRSPNVFVGEAPGESQLPTPSVIAGHPAIAFGGRNRIVNPPSTVAAMGTSLHLRDGTFALAMVFQPAQAPQVIRTFMAYCGGEWLSSESVFPPQITFAVTLSHGIVSVYSNDDGFASATQPVADEAPHVLVVSRGPNELVGRIDGIPVLTLPSIARPAKDQHLYIGAWDWDVTGFIGNIGDVILFDHQPPEAVVLETERYLLRKYGVPEPR